MNYSEFDLQMLGFRMYDNETGRFTTPDLLWSAFPAQTPYHYAYNSPLTYRDPSGLAPEKEKEGDELLWLNPDDASGGYYFGIWNAQETDRSMAMTYAHNMIFAYLDMMYSDVCQWNDDFNTNFGSTSGGSRDGGTTSSATNGQVGNKTDDNRQGDNQLNNESNIEEDATDMYNDDSSEATVLDDISEKSRRKSWSQTVRDQAANEYSEAGGTIKYDDNGNEIVVEAEVGEKYANKVDVFNVSSDMDDIDIYSSYKATYHGHTNNDRAGQYPNYSDLGTFMTGPRFSDIRYHMTYITTIPQRVFVWDNATGRGYNFSPDVWKGKK